MSGTVPNTPPPITAGLVWSAGQWTNAWMQKADANAVLSLSTGGTVLGPINYTATGGTVARSAQNRAADVVNILDYGADPTGATDSSAAINAALATQKNVYAPAGNYLLIHMVTVGNEVGGGGTSQTFFGNGHNTAFIIDQRFDPTAVAVFLLRGAEAFRAMIHDIRISFTQPQTTNGSVTRATFLTLAQGGTSTTPGTGIKYPPAIMWGNDATSANRFRIFRVRVEGAWDGLIQGQFGTGGFIIDDIEMGALNNGLVIGDIGDHSQVRSYHNWYFGFVSNTDIGHVRADGQVIGIQLGNAQTGNQAAGITFSNIQMFNARLQIDAYGGGGLHFSNLQMDGTHSSVTMTEGDHCHISNIYFSNSAGQLQPCIWLKTGAGGNYGRMFIKNIFGWHADFPMIQMDDGILKVSGGYIYGTTSAFPAVPTIQQTGGWMEISEMSIASSNTTAAPVQIHGTAGGPVIWFHDNSFPGVTGTTNPPMPAMTIDIDNWRNRVQDNFWGGGGWTFMPPGPNGVYGPNNTGVLHGTGVTATQNYYFGVNATLSSYFGDPTVGPPYSACNIAVVTASGGIHLGQNAGVVLTDTSTTFEVGGAFVDNSGQGASNPASGSTLQIPDNCGLYTIETTGIAALTVGMPVNPKVNQQLRIFTTGTITNLTLTPPTGSTHTIPFPISPFSLRSYSSLLFVWANGPWFQLSGV